MGGGPISSSGVTQYKYESFDMMQRKMNRRTNVAFIGINEIVSIVMI